MRIAVCADRNERELIRMGIDTFGEKAGISTALDEYGERSELLYRLREQHYDAAIIAVRGADGLEIVSGARDIDSELPIIWITDDRGFGMMSYRLQVRGFLGMPVTPEQVSDALRQCLPIFIGADNRWDCIPQ